MRVLLGDQVGRVRAEVTEGRIGDVVWRLNQSGSATLRVKRGSAAFALETLDPGARVYVEFDNGLPAWGGVLDLPRAWLPGMVEIKAYTIERLLAFQMTAKTRGFYGEVAGSIFSQILAEADRRALIGLTMGTVWMGGAVHYPRYHFRDAMWVVDDSIRKMENCDYRFVPYLDDNRIMFRAELHELLGNDKRESVALVEGANVARAGLTEQGEIVNRVVIVGSGATWGERTVIWGREETSRARFGLREAMLAPSDVTQPDTLNRYADNAIRESAYPHTLADLTVADVVPARFADYDVGDVVRVILPAMGFNGYDAPMRIVARGFDPWSGKCELVCDERFEYLPVMQDEDENQPGE